MLNGALGLDGHGAARANTQVAVWLSAVAVLVAAMVIVGGATRLTNSGLSITEWQPLLGAIPPMSEAAWSEAFAKYKTIPQAAIVNKAMTLDEFKFIYRWEWGHRQLGRFIGIAFAVPFIWFYLRGSLTRALTRRLAFILGLGALQGAAGWFMVKSGLVERIDVSPYRLALHLALAVIIFAALVSTVLDLRAVQRPGRIAFPHDQVTLARLLPPLVLVQIVLGAFVAGNKAGHAYNTWPTMDGRWIPDNMTVLSPWWTNLTENMTTVQFNHRLVAYVIVAVTLWHVVAICRSTAAAAGVVRSALLLAAAVLLQVGLGILAVLAAVPISLGLAHQAGAIVVMAMAIAHAHRTCDPAARAALLSD